MAFLFPFFPNSLYRSSCLSVVVIFGVVCVSDWTISENLYFLCFSALARVGSWYFYFYLWLFVGYPIKLFNLFGNSLWFFLPFDRLFLYRTKIMHQICLKLSFFSALFSTMLRYQHQFFLKLVLISTCHRPNTSA